jgi:hypothetical protein
MAFAFKLPNPSIISAVAAATMTFAATAAISSAAVAGSTGIGIGVVTGLSVLKSLGSGEGKRLAPHKRHVESGTHRRSRQTGHKSRDDDDDDDDKPKKKSAEDSADPGIQQSSISVEAVKEPATAPGEAKDPSAAIATATAGQPVDSAAPGATTGATAPGQATSMAAPGVTSGMTVPGAAPARPNAAATPAPASINSTPGESVAAMKISTPAEISAAQDHLRYLGYDVATSSGQLDLQTKIAIMKFQDSVGSPATGELTIEQLQRLFVLAAEKSAKK